MLLAIRGINKDIKNKKRFTDNYGHNISRLFAV